MLDIHCKALILKGFHVFFRKNQEKAEKSVMTMNICIKTIFSFSGLRNEVRLIRFLSTFPDLFVRTSAKLFYFLSNLRKI